ncbi:DUF6531 domain-containing protein [Dyella silvae]|uniref:DUF6531 domain-containing protein n=1 Tax=Dyella silvae TaxID=2994424 RepID=UPI002264AD71|nr:DUF6531 domain-containing protein [Dyella silvae]
MHFVSKLRMTLLVVALLCAAHAHAQDGSSGSSETKDGKSVNTDPSVNVRADISKEGGTVTVEVPPTVPMPNLSGVFLTPTGNGFLGQGYTPANPNNTPSNLGAQNPGVTCPVGDPILPATGTKIETYPLFSLPGEMGLRYILYYNSANPSNMASADHWSDNFAYFLDLSCWTFPSYGVCSQITLFRPDGSTVVWGHNASPYAKGSGVATYSQDASTGNYTVYDEDATVQVYSSTGHLLSIKNASGVGWTISGNEWAGTVMTVTHTNGQSFTVQRSSGSTVVTDPAGNVYTIQLGPNATLSSITYPGSPTTTVSFKYLTLTSPRNFALSEVDYNGVPYAYTTYSTNPQSFYGWATGTYLTGGSQQTTVAYYKESSGNLSATITNPLGYQSVQTFNASGNLIQVSGSAMQTCGATLSGRTYDTNNHLAAEIDNNGNTHAYTYAANGQLQTETAAYGAPEARTTDYVWDPNATLNRPLSVTVRGWQKTTYTYNAQNRLASVAVTNLSGNGSANQTLTTTYNYTLYGNGMVQTMTVTRPSPNGTDTDTYTYDALGNLASLSNGLGQTTAYSYYNALGQPGRVVGPNGDVTSYTYDARGRIGTKTTYPNGAAATWTYGYDGFGLLASLWGPDGQNTTWSRDARMWVSSITHNDKDGTSTESFNYDANGDVQQHTVSRGGTVGLVNAFQYDSLGRIYQKIGQHGQTLTYAYDGNGNVLSTTNAMGHTVVSQYDALDRVTQQTESGGASPPIPATVSGINLPSYTWLPVGSASKPYTVSWNSVPYATTYILQEQVNDGSWVTVQSGSAISWSAGGKARGTYHYRVAACDTTGCSGWSPAGVYVINGPNPELPAILLMITSGA